jgi:hypothetical protein
MPRRSPTSELRALALVTLLALPLALAACGTGGTTQIGAEPTRDWPSEAPCPPSLTSVCADKGLSLVSTINEPQGTRYGISSSEQDVFVICRWPPGAVASTCELLPSTGAQVVGEAAVYRVEE